MHRGWQLSDPGPDRGAARWRAGHAGRCNGDAGAEQLKFQTLTWLCSTIDAGAGVFYRVGEDFSQSQFLVHRADPAFHRRYVRGLHQLDPLHPRHFQGVREPVITLSDALPPGVRRDSEYFHTFIAPQSIREVIEVFFRYDGRIVAGISLLKYGCNSPLSARDIRLIRDTHPLIESYLGYVLGGAQEDCEDGAAADEAFAFTERERVIVALVKEGLSNKVIARRLAISVPTVKTHVRSILAKTGTTSRPTLLVKMFRGGAAAASGAGAGAA